MEIINNLKHTFRKNPFPQTLSLAGIVMAFSAFIIIRCWPYPSHGSQSAGIWKASPNIYPYPFGSILLSLSLLKRLPHCWYYGDIMP